MSTDMMTTKRNGEIMEKVAIEGDLSRLTPEERTSYYLETCKSLGLNPYTKPFGYLKLDAGTQLYALKAATDQLRQIHGVSVVNVRSKVEGDILTVWVDVVSKDGRKDTDMGAVCLSGEKGAKLANAHMKALTKAKRRATLSICGLGWLDESELDTLPEARVQVQEPKALPAPAKPAAKKPASGKSLGMQLCDRIMDRDKEFAASGLIKGGDLIAVFKAYIAQNQFAAEPKAWTPEQVAAAEAYMHEWEQCEGITPTT